MRVLILRRIVAVVAVAVICSGDGSSATASQAGHTDLPIVSATPAQPLREQVHSLVNVLQSLGSPVPQTVQQNLNLAMTENQDDVQTAGVQRALDVLCLYAVQINPESRVSVALGPAKPLLVQRDWRLFLVKIYNQAGVTAALHVSSPNRIGEAGDARDRWLDIKLYSQRDWVSYAGNDPVPPRDQGLTGLPVEYRILQVYSRDAGIRQARVMFDVGQGTQDLGFRNEATTLFRCATTIPCKIQVADEHGKPSMAMVLIRDSAGRIYPSAVGRLAPDFFFQPQVYRSNAETVSLPAGDYQLTVGRGPEYTTHTEALHVDTTHRSIAVKLSRWIDPSKQGWWSGDHHIHAAGCRHYTNPTAGVKATDMIRSCLGEDLKVGCNLTWGPCFDYQKQFFTGKIDAASVYPYLLRYDVEVSGFGSHESGHLCLLRLQQEIYPGGDSYKHWPKLGLSTLRWAKQQGAVCGPAHSGFGLESGTVELPNYVVPKYNGIGANEYIVDVTHRVPGPDGKLVPAVDFMSTCDTPYSNELNIWYHTLNCGFRTRISGETDFPCISGERVGKGRSYVKLGDKLDFDAWCEGIREGRCYVSDGASHLIDFAVNGVGVGEHKSEVKLNGAASVHVTVNAAGLLSNLAPADVHFDSYWNIEHARVGTSRTIPIELIVNGYPVARQIIVADGKINSLQFDAKIDRSSWIAVRVLGSSHTNPIFVTVGEKPIRASRRSAQWCLDSVEQCWKSKQQFYAVTGETGDAKLAYEHAREAYRAILNACEVD